MPFDEVTIGNCRRIEQAYAQPRLFEDAKVGAGETAVQGDMLLPANETPIGSLMWSIEPVLRGADPNDPAAWTIF